MKVTRKIKGHSASKVIKDVLKYNKKDISYISSENFKLNHNNTVATLFIPYKGINKVMIFAKLKVLDDYNSIITIKIKILNGSCKGNYDFIFKSQKDIETKLKEISINKVVGEYLITDSFSYYIRELRNEIDMENNSFLELDINENKD